MGQLNLSAMNVSLIALADIVWIYYYFKCKKIEERLIKLEKENFA